MYIINNSRGTILFNGRLDFYRDRWLKMKVLHVGTVPVVLS